MAAQPDSPRPDARGEVLLTVAMMVLTAVAAVMLSLDLLVVARADDWRVLTVLRLGALVVVLTVLVSGNVVYQVSRLGYLLRTQAHEAPSFGALIEESWEDAEPIVALVPSFKEDQRTIRQTLTSAVFQHHPKLRVALLLDDPPWPADDESRELLAAGLRVPEEVTATLAEARGIVEVGYTSFLASEGEEPHGPGALLRTLDSLASWARHRAALEVIADHTDAHFVEVTWRRQAQLLEERLRMLADRDPRGWSRAGILREFGRLLEAYTCEVSAFQRKRHANLTHEHNKAANLNAYIDLLGSNVREVEGAQGLWLERVEAGRGLPVPDASFVLTLDADSLLDPEYALRLSATFAAPGNERLAVVQTPYTAIPGATGLLERIAGATTDIQYIVHQGFTWCGATFWVGANALLRKEALMDIRAEDTERGHTIARYIQDRTVIEDTESTLDLAERGWDLHNVPQRLAWSATPPDFGSLAIQRSRWANGGLLIAPKALRRLLARPLDRLAVPAFLIRMHYLTSIATGSLGLLALLFLPLGGDELRSLWLPLISAPYFVLYARDLVLSGYRTTDMGRVFALNLMLVPVHLAGVFKSIHQGLTGKRIPFGRTPKVSGRTAAPAWAVLSIWVMTLWCVVSVGVAVATGRWINATGAAVTGAALAYAAVAFIGLREGVEDIGRMRPGLRPRASGPRRRLQPMA
ncbi:glycosyltransferase family 2 protein [Tessaracoccus sp. Y1736]